MKISQHNYYRIHLPFLALLLLLGCKRDEPKEKVSANSFSMRVNKQVWTPFQAKDDPCTSTYTSQYTLLGEEPIYTIYAYRDPNGTANADSENLLRIQIVNVTEPGIYLLDGTYKEDFDSYFVYQIKKSGNTPLRYVNTPHRSPVVVNVEEVYIRPGASIPSIKGSFSGVLYNEANPSDSLIIEAGQFNFKYVGVNYNRQCE